MAQEPLAGAEQGAQDQVFQTFPTTILWRTYPNAAQLNMELARIVRRLRDAGSAVSGTSTVGGFQTNNEFLKIDEPAIRTLRSMLNNSVHAFLVPYLQENLTQPPQSVAADM